MFERFRHTPEIVHEIPSPHEAGGIGIEGWDTVFDYSTRRDLPLTESLTLYGTAIRDGMMTDDNFSHRNYLSRKDWFVVEDVLRDDTLQQARYRRGKKDPWVMTLLDELKLYAYLEAEYAFTHEDYKRELRTRERNKEYKKDFTDVHIPMILKKIS